MRPSCVQAIMLAMVRSITPSKVLLVRDRRSASAGPGAAHVRRYRLARLRLDGRELAPAFRITRPKRVYD
ncbi:MAG: hypothetical protein JOY58_13055 [Solirubrobacterales bacterium]|nr:hypothetical protein [Solirubrobacterales bacterium]